MPTSKLETMLFRFGKRLSHPFENFKEIFWSNDRCLLASRCSISTWYRRIMPILWIKLADLSRFQWYRAVSRRGQREAAIFERCTRTGGNSRIRRPHQKKSRNNSLVWGFSSPIFAFAHSTSSFWVIDSFCSYLPWCSPIMSCFWCTVRDHLVWCERWRLAQVLCWTEGRKGTQGGSQIQVGMSEFK